LSTGTTELSLPGLQMPTHHPEENHSRFIERPPQKRLMVFSGRSNPDLAAKIAEHLGVELGAVTLKTFANGETYCRYEDSIRGADVFIVQTGSVPVDRNLWELGELIQAAKLGSAKRITAVVPWYPYSRQDRKSSPREPITAKLVADFLQVAGVDRVLTMDLHAGQIQGFFDIPVDHMTALTLFAQYFRDKGLYGDRVVSVAPDTGRAKLAEKFGQMLDARSAFLTKSRPAHDQAAISAVSGDVEGKIALMGDDMIVTGGTLVAGAEALKAAGATEVYVFATHPILAHDALTKLSEADLTEIVVTDTIPIDLLHKPDNVTVLSVSRLLADTIRNVFSDDSVSAIFGGENQLF
jgi:ribose-phosphate pyrophosphokinase